MKPAILQKKKVAALAPKRHQIVKYTYPATMKPAILQKKKVAALAPYSPRWRHHSGCERWRHVGFEMQICATFAPRWHNVGAALAPYLPRWRHNGCERRRHVGFETHIYATLAPRWHDVGAALAPYSPRWRHSGCERWRHVGFETHIYATFATRWRNVWSLLKRALCANAAATTTDTTRTASRHTGWLVSNVQWSPRQRPPQRRRSAAPRQLPPLAPRRGVAQGDPHVRVHVSLWGVPCQPFSVLAAELRRIFLGYRRARGRRASGVNFRPKKPNAFLLRSNCAHTPPTPHKPPQFTRFHGRRVVSWAVALALTLALALAFAQCGAEGGRGMPK